VIQCDYTRVIMKTDDGPMACKHASVLEYPCRCRAPSTGTIQMVIQAMSTEEVASRDPQELLHFITEIAMRPPARDVAGQQSQIPYAGVHCGLPSIPGSPYTLLERPSLSSSSARHSSRCHRCRLYSRLQHLIALFPSLQALDPLLMHLLLHLLEAFSFFLDGALRSDAIDTLLLHD
jgi:hypothetical protein